VLALGAIIRDWFNRYEAGAHGVEVQWQWPVSGAMAIGLIAFSAWKPSGGIEISETVTTPVAMAIVQARCATCHSVTPTDEGFDQAPGGIMFDNAAQVKALAARIMAQAVRTDAMPLGNLTEMTDEERAKIGAWIDAGMPDE
jgi:uncharacterized membrane protein